MKRTYILSIIFAVLILIFSTVILILVLINRRTVKQETLETFETTYSPNVTEPFSVILTGPTNTTLTQQTSTVTPKIALTTATKTSTMTSITTTTSTTTTVTSTTITTTITIRTTITITTTETKRTTPTAGTLTSVTAGGYLAFSLFYPNNLTQRTCPSNYSWTMWFNVGQPNITVGSDTEDMSIILDKYPTATCSAPYGAHVQSLNARVNDWLYEWSWYSRNGTLYLLSFQSFESGDIDFRIRYCCPIGSFVSLITTTSTPRPLDSSTCGKQQITSRPSLISKIYGGTEVIPNSWPWMILYEDRILVDNRTIYGRCGGTLLNNNYVMTAAYCIETNNSSGITLIAGMHDRTSTTETTQQLRTVDAIYVHPQYGRATTSLHDIAILRVATPFVFNNYVQPACLPGAEPQPNDEVIILGWGTQTVGGSFNSVLQQAYTRIVGDCDNLWSTVDNSRQICVADSVNGNSACQGDGGGPILSLHQGQYVVSGVASYTKYCNTLGVSKLPNVYTRVAAYLDWIKSIIQ